MKTKETVVLLHGIGRTASSLKNIEQALQQQGYQTMAITYPSTKHNIENLAQYLHENHLTQAFWANQGKVHFVTHSMGGLVTRYYLDKYRNAKIGRVVMLGPPNNGSEIADCLHRFRLYQWFYGPAGGELTTTLRIHNQFTPYYDVGVIAGTKRWPYFVARFMIKGQSDGRVSVQSTKLEGMIDHISLPASHTFMMDNVAVQRQTLHFLQNGTFQKA